MVRKTLYVQQQCLTVHHVSKCMSCQKSIVVITGKVRCFHDYMYNIHVIMKTTYLPGYHHNAFPVTHLASVRFEHSVCHGSLMTTYIYIYIYIYIWYGIYMVFTTE